MNSDVVTRLSDALPLRHPSHWSCFFFFACCNSQPKLTSVIFDHWLPFSKYLKILNIISRTWLYYTCLLHWNEEFFLYKIEKLNKVYNNYRKTAKATFWNFIIYIFIISGDVKKNGPINIKKCFDKSFRIFKSNTIISWEYVTFGCQKLIFFIF